MSSNRLFVLMSKLLSSCSSISQTSHTDFLLLTETRPKEVELCSYLHYLIIEFTFSPGYDDLKEHLLSHLIHVFSAIFLYYVDSRDSTYNISNVTVNASCAYCIARNVGNPRGNSRRANQSKEGRTKIEEM